MYINIGCTITSHNYVHLRENSVQSISKIILGILQENNTDNIYDNNTCIYYNLMSYTAHGVYSGSGSSCRNLGAGRLCERIDRIPSIVADQNVPLVSHKSVA